MWNEIGTAFSIIDEEDRGDLSFISGVSSDVKLNIYHKFHIENLSNVSHRK